MSKLETKTYQENGNPGEFVPLRIGDNVRDAISGWSFIVEEIREDGWVWGSEMRIPYLKDGSKNFMDNHISWKM
jgi:hypothetical protein